MTRCLHCNAPNAPGLAACHVCGRALQPAQPVKPPAQPTEQIIFDVRPTIIKPMAMLVIFVILLIIGLVLPVGPGSIYCVRPVAFVVMLLTLKTWLTYATTNYILTTHQVYTIGIMGGRRIPLSHVQSVSWHKGVLGWGDVLITSAGGPLYGNIRMAGVDAPDALARQITASI